MNVLDEEYKSICQAFRKVANITPKVLIVVGQRSQTMQFFPADHTDANRYGNVKAGTVVDRDIAAEGYLNFYMCPQDGIVDRLEELQTRPKDEPSP